MKIFVFVFLLLALHDTELYSQNSADKIRKNREKALKEIEYANKLLLETQGKTKESLNEINVINHRLKKRKEFVLGMELEVNVISQVMEENLNAASSMQMEIDKIKEVYGKLIYNLYKNKSLSLRIMYFLASENMNQLYKRVSIVKIYNNFLKGRKEKLEELKRELLQKNQELEKMKSEKDLLVRGAKRESITIEREMTEKQRIVAQLKRKQKDIENEIREKERTARKLENELKKMIDEERRRVKATGKKEILTPAEKIISNDFAKNEGSLPWPTERGIITGQYGEHQHPDYKSVIIRNDGVFISTSKGESVRSIFKGVISRVFTIPGQNYTVIIKHGDYYTLYHNLINVMVKPGQSVNTKQIIGTVFTDEITKETILHFQVWKETERKDPELWLAN
ncbi:MAG: peptidoglycan DD-metalloendopeptidase family protein [Bacteroidales bacterium]|nr:peptidoglycan DD-metalloendopeptidase family protein [Bacteroidales bacterium]